MAAAGRGLVVAVLGAESTGKTALAQALVQALAVEGRRATMVEETLRHFCDAQGRTPRIDEQAGIAAAHTAAIEAAAAAHEVVIADTTALQTAIYSDWVFGDRSLYAGAETWQRDAVDLTLLTALDLPWQADGLQRDGPQVREPIDGLIRTALQRAGVGYAVIAGEGAARHEAALAAVHRLWLPRPEAGDAARAPRWQWVCERCGDAGCERHWLARS